MLVKDQESEVLGNKTRSLSLSDTRNLNSLSVKSEENRTLFFPPSFAHSPARSLALPGSGKEHCRAVLCCVTSKCIDDHVISEFGESRRRQSMATF